MSQQYLVLEQIMEQIDTSPETDVATIHFEQGRILRSILGAQIDYTLAIGQPTRHMKDPVVEIHANGINLSAVNVRDEKGISIANIKKDTKDVVEGHKVVGVDYTPELRKFVHYKVKRKSPCDVIINDERLSIFTDKHKISVNTNPIEQLEEENFFIKITEAEAKQNFTGIVEMNEKEFKKWYGSIWNLCHRSIFLNRITTKLSETKIFHSIAYNEESIRDTLTDFGVQFFSPNRMFLCQRAFRSQGEINIKIQGEGYSIWRFNWNTLKKALESTDRIRMLLPNNDKDRYIIELLGHRAGISFIESQQKTMNDFIQDTDLLSMQTLL
jgi:hypothetical protein